MKCFATALALALISTAAAQAAPVQWSSNAGGNGHWYEFIDYPDHLSWEDARVAAQTRNHNGQTGYLGTITSQEEQSFLNTIWNNAGAAVGGVLLGGHEVDGIEGNWQWITGEDFTYTNWNAGEPNDLYGETYIVGWWNHNPNGNWNDTDNTWATAYLVEYGPADISAVPLPAGLPLLGAGLLAFGAIRRKRKAAA